MIIISSRKFRDSQNEILRSALEEEVILTTIHYGSFKLVPIKEGEEHFVHPHIDVPARKQAVPEPVKIKVETPVPEPPKEEKVSFVAPETKQVIDEKEESAATVVTVPETIREQASKADTIVTNTSLETPIRKRNPHSYSFSGQRKPISTKNPFAVEMARQEAAEHKAAPAPALIPEPVVVSEPEIELPMEHEEPMHTQHIPQVPTPKPIIKEPEPVFEEVAPKATIEDTKPKSVEKPIVSTREVFVDPSLLTIDELLEQEGFEPLSKKKGFFNKLFKK